MTQAKATRANIANRAKRTGPEDQRTVGSSKPELIGWYKTTEYTSYISML
jgi:hypothetical protein